MEEWEFVVNEEGDSGSDHGIGHWKSKRNGQKLGGDKGKLEFTVISLTVANHMLSLHGSLLRDPFKGPPPTLDRGYLKKSLLPSQALGLGSSATNRFTRSNATPVEDTIEAIPAATPVVAARRVRWKDEDESSATGEGEEGEGEGSDLEELDTPAVVKAEVGSKGGKKEKSKRKSTSVVPGESDEGSASKKRRKEA